MTSDTHTAPGGERFEIALNRIVDRAESAADWEVVHGVAADAAGGATASVLDGEHPWFELARRLEEEFRLREAAMDLFAVADRVDLPIERVAAGGGLGARFVPETVEPVAVPPLGPGSARRPRAAVSVGWIAAACLAIGWTLSVVLGPASAGGSDSGRLAVERGAGQVAYRDGEWERVVGDAGRGDAAAARVASLPSPADATSVGEELPRIVLGTRPRADGRGDELVFVRRTIASMPLDTEVETYQVDPGGSLWRNRVPAASLVSTGQQSF